MYIYTVPTSACCQELVAFPGDCARAVPMYVGMYVCTSAWVKELLSMTYYAECTLGYSDFQREKCVRYFRIGKDF